MIKILSGAIYMNAKEDTKLYKKQKDLLCVAPNYGKKRARAVFKKDFCGDIFMNLGTS